MTHSVLDWGQRWGSKHVK